jgi:3-oxocholest-4-en-26-oyl-CoA dehydrogenase beta subunit
MTETATTIDFELGEEQLAVREVARAIFAPRLGSAPGVGEDWLDHSAWAAMAQADLIGAGVSANEGGSGFGLLELCTLLEEVGRHLVRVPALETVAVAAPAVDRFGSDEQRRRLLPATIAGERLAVAALSEPRSYDPLAVRAATATLSGTGSWRLHGVKSDVPFAESAETILAPARCDGSRVAVFVVEASAVERERSLTTSGRPDCRLTLPGVTAELLGSVADGPEIHRWMLRRAIVGTCAVQVGVIDQALRMTARYTSERHQFGRPLAAFQAVALRAADGYADVEAARATMWQAAWSLQSARPADSAIAVAKFWAAEAGRRVTATAQHLHGGIGVDLDYPLHRYTRWSKQNELAFGGAYQQLAGLGQLLARDSA